jgi:hypothetical protein
VGRAIAAIEALHHSATHVSTATLLKILDAAVPELNAAPGTATTNFSYEIESVFKALQGAQDVPAIEVARREYAYLPLFSYRETPLTLYRLLAEDPALFVSVLCDVFKPSSGEAREPTEERRARAQAGFRLLMEFHLVPGVHNGDVDSIALTAWVTEVRRLAAAEDRFEIANEYIGHVLAHSPADPDGAWPHRTVRGLIEKLASEDVERGIDVERFNMRGVTSRGPFDGGDQERAIAATVRGWSKATRAWPRTSAMLEQIARGWEHQGEREDERAKQDLLRFG